MNERGRRLWAAEAVDRGCGCGRGRFCDGLTQRGLTIHACHLPPGTNRWNKIEHGLFSFISRNRCGRPLLTHATIVNLISATKAQGGLRVGCELN